MQLTQDSLFSKKWAASGGTRTQCTCISDHNVSIKTCSTVKSAPILTDDNTSSTHCLPILCLLLLLLLWSSCTGSSLGSSHGTSGQAQVFLKLLCVHIFTTSKHVALGITITPQLMQLNLHIHKTGIFTTDWNMWWWKFTIFPNVISPTRAVGGMRLRESWRDS